MCARSYDEREEQGGCVQGAMMLDHVNFEASLGVLFTSSESITEKVQKRGARWMCARSYDVGLCKLYNNNKFIIAGKLVGWMTIIDNNTCNIVVKPIVLTV